MSTQPSTSRIKIANPALEDNNRTYIQEDIAAAATTVNVVSVTGFPGTTDDDYYVIIGDYEDEKAEIVLVDASATTSSQLTISATSYSHSAADPITYIGYNKIRIYGMTTESGTKNIVTTIAIDTTEQYTEYIYTGTTYSYFCTAYYNEDDDEISGYSDVISAATYTRFSSKKVIQSAAIKAMTRIDDNQDAVLNWDNAIEILQDGVDEIIARKRKWPFLRTINSSTTTTINQAYIDYPSDLSQLQYIKINGNIQEWVSLLDYSRFTEGNVASKGVPRFATERNGKVYLEPTPNEEYQVIFDYYKLPATITSLGTEVEKPFLTPLIYYCASQFAYIRGNDKRGDKMYAMFDKLLEQQVVEYSGPDQTGFAEYVESTSDINDDYLIY